jgi:release factor glutamine methyltransferase
MRDSEILVARSADGRHLVDLNVTSPRTHTLPIPGVYGPCRDSELIAEAIPESVRAGDRTLDLCTGSGVLAITAARFGAAEAWAVDVSRRSVLAATLNARLNGVRIHARRGHLFGPVAGRRFDLITANPPYVPQVDEGPVRGAARAWEAGPDGRKFIDPLLEGLTRHLRPGGRVLLVHSSLCGVERSLAQLDQAGLDADVVLSESAPLGPITAPRAAALERLGLLQDGARNEDTVVIRGVLRSPVAVTAAQPTLATA